MGSLTVNGTCRITKDSELRKTTNGNWYNFGVAAYRKNAKEGKQNVDFFECELYQKNPPPGLETQLIKGRLIFIESAYLRNDQFVGTDGKDKTRVKMQISAFELLQDNVTGEAPRPSHQPAYTPKPKTDSTHPSDLGVPMEVPKKEYTKPNPLPDDMGPAAFDFNDEEPPF